MDIKEDMVYLEDVTGTLGEWLDSQFDDAIPISARMYLQMAYDECAKELG